MKILGLFAENFKKLKAVTIIPGQEQNVVKITGGNEEGKTTVLEAIWAALGGKKFVPDVPIRTGEKKAIVSLDLGDLVVNRKMTPSGESLEVTNKDGAVYKSPQAILDKLISGLSFDPLAFVKMGKQTQVDTLLGVVDIKVDDERLKKISTVPRLPDSKNPLVKFKVAYDFIYNERTEVNRDLKKAKELLESLPPVDKTEPVSLVELVNEKESLEKINRENLEKRDVVNKQCAEVSELEANMKATEAQIKQLQETLKAQTVAWTDASMAYNDALDSISELKDEDLSDINERIAKADETNAKAKRYEQREVVKISVDQNQADSDRLTATLEAIKQYRQELLENAAFPVPGLSFGDDGITYEGLPLEQASSSRRLLISMSIAAALHPELKVVTIDEAEKLDAKKWQIVEDFAREHDLQVWATVVDTSGKVGIVIEDGEVVAPGEKGVDEYVAVNSGD
jgi:hypothetical protein